MINGEVAVANGSDDMDANLKYDDGKEVNALSVSCSDKSLAEIAINVVNCDQLWPFLDISKAAHEEILRDNKGSYRNYKHNLLLAWREKHGAQATYQNLCNAFEESKNREGIDIVRKQALKEYESDSDASSTTSGYSPSLDSELDGYEDFEPDPGSSSFADLLDSIMEAVEVDCTDRITTLKTKVIIMLNSNSRDHSIPPRYIEKLSRCKCDTTDKIFEYFWRYIKRENPAVLKIMVESSGCKKAIDLYKDYFG